MPSQERRAQKLIRLVPSRVCQIAGLGRCGHAIRDNVRSPYVRIMMREAMNTNHSLSLV